ncbi:hypothetical protein ACHQM5_021333 [Ranunculus cassubicifolius]
MEAHNSVHNTDIQHVREQWRVSQRSHRSTLTETERAAARERRRVRYRQRIQSMTAEQLARQRQLRHDQYVRHRQSTSNQEQRTTPTQTSRIRDPPPPLTSQDINYVLQQLRHHVDEEVSRIFGEKTAPLLDIHSGNLSISDGKQIHLGPYTGPSSTAEYACA